MFSDLGLLKTTETRKKFGKVFFFFFFHFCHNKINLQRYTEVDVCFQPVTK